MYRNLISSLEKNKDFLAITEKLGTDIKKWKFLGEGSYGRAYDLRDGRACKITTNWRETSIAIRLKKRGKKYSYLYEIIDVFTIKVKNVRYGIIITPKYEKLTKHQRTELFELFCLLDSAPSFRIRSIKQIKDKITKAAINYSISHHIDIDRTIKKRLKSFKKFDILYMLRNLKTANLGPEDIHFENILKNKDHFILIDLGC